MPGERFKLSVAGIGDFTFRDRTMRDQLRIESVASDILGRRVQDLRPDELGLLQFALGFAHLSTLTVEAPAGWDIEAMDPLDRDESDKLLRVYGELSSELARFREERKSGRQPAGPTA